MRRGQPKFRKKLLALYDGPIAGAPSYLAFDMVDASAMLWRLSATGHPMMAHRIDSRAVLIGMERAVREMKDIIEQARR